MNLAYFGRPKVFKIGPRPKTTILGPVFSTILAVLKGTENLAYVLIPKGETNETSNYQKGKPNKMSYIISWFVMEMCFNAKTQNLRIWEKMRIYIFLTLSIFFVKCAVARSFKAFFILTNISKHIF